jgi:hypothetical protein
MSKLQSINPSNYELLGEIETSSSDEIIKKFNLAKQSQKE